MKRNDPTMNHTIAILAGGLVYGNGRLAGLVEKRTKGWVHSLAQTRYHRNSKDAAHALVAARIRRGMKRWKEMR